VHALSIAEARFTLGRLPPIAFSEVGVCMLEAGHDSEAIRSLAALREDEAPSAGSKLFRRVLTELGRDPLSREDALRLYLGVVSRQILAGEVSPCEGVRQIWTEAIEATGTATVGTVTRRIRVNSSSSSGWLATAKTP
jgi:hypothetical protein